MICLSNFFVYFINTIKEKVNYSKPISLCSVCLFVCLFVLKNYRKSYSKAGTCDKAKSRKC